MNKNLTPTEKVMLCTKRVDVLKCIAERHDVELFNVVYDMTMELLYSAKLEEGNKKLYYEIMESMIALKLDANKYM